MSTDSGCDTTCVVSRLHSGARLGGCAPCSSFSPWLRRSTAAISTPSLRSFWAVYTNPAPHHCVLAHSRISNQCLHRTSGRLSDEQNHCRILHGEPPPQPVPTLPVGDAVMGRLRYDLQSGIRRPPGVHAHRHRMLRAAFSPHRLCHRQQGGRRVPQGGGETDQGCRQCSDEVASG
jgi:hypothetical protein